MDKGFLITFEGGEGCGKSTHSNSFCEYLISNGYDVLHTREPGGTPLGEAIRNVVKDPKYIDRATESELLLFEASRAELCKKIIRPALNSGKIVVVDRFCDSTMAYQGYGRNINKDFIQKLNLFATDDLIPNLTFYLRIDPQVAFKRKGGAELDDAMELQTLDFHYSVQKGFDEIAKQNPNRVVVIDSDRERNVVAQHIIDIFKERYE